MEAFTVLSTITALLLLVLFIGYYVNRAIKKEDFNSLNKNIIEAQKSGFTESYLIAGKISLSEKTREIATYRDDIPLIKFDDIKSIRIEEVGGGGRRYGYTEFHFKILIKDKDGIYIHVKSFKSMLDIFGVLCAALGRNLTSSCSTNEKDILTTASDSLDDLFDGNNKIKPVEKIQ